MPRSILLAFLLIGTVCAMHLEYLKADSDEETLDDFVQAVVQAVAQADVLAEEQKMNERKLPGPCWACKWAMNKLKTHLGQNEKAEAIKKKLLKVCDGIGLLKNICQKIIHKFIDTLTEELSTSDDPKTICINIGICKAKPLPKYLQAFPKVQQQL
ncbi:antimicrobial peptide NK-lysin-like isoform X2 [Salminus brasiliensis]|uniref:antimicrobial peptide NK-lysin-like isoform X2 n=1 Tax=Salminus brasiliensis TaxID=930266 RepID=UPI003B82DBCA